MKLFTSRVTTAALLVLFVPAPAAAYLNPDSGSMLLQLLLGGAAGAGVLLKVYWRRIASLFRREGSAREEERPL